MEAGGVPLNRRSSVAEELSRQEMERVRRAFVGVLQRRGFSWGFIEEEGEEALAIAFAEYARALDKGVEIDEPVAWTVNCAWRRTQNLLTAEGRRPRSVSTEKLLELPDEEEPGPAEILEESDRQRKIREAVEQLDEAQRQVIALTYYEGMSVREAARRLGWHPSKAQYAHKTAKKSLLASLGVTSSDQIAIGLAAFLTFGAHKKKFASLPAGVEAIVDRAEQGATGVWGRLHDLARRLGPGGGGDTAGALASSGAGRAAGVCAAGVAAVCIGTAGVIGGVGLGGGHHHHQPPPPHRAPQARVHDHPGPRQTTAPFVDEEVPSVATTTPSGPTPRGAATGAGTKTSSTGVGSETGPAKKEPAPAAGISQPRRQFRGTDHALVAAESGGTGGEEEAASDYAATSGENSSSTTSSTSASSTSGSGAEEASASETSAAKSQFDAFAKAR